jgi:hypothetical protein
MRSRGALFILCASPISYRLTGEYVRRLRFVHRQREMCWELLRKRADLIDVLMGFPALVRIFRVGKPKIDNLVAKALVGQEQIG